MFLDVVAVRTAFVLSGGGSLGAVEVGMLQALVERQIEPDLIVGTSVGAINAAWIAGRPGLAGVSELAALWRSVRRRDVFPVNRLAGFEGFIGRADHLVSSKNLRRLLSEHLTYERLEQAPVPIRAVTTDITTGLEVVLDKGPSVDAVMASAAIPAVFAPVMIDGRFLVDGGVADNTPISHAVDAGASVVYVLPTGYTCSLRQPPRDALAMALQALTLLVHERLPMSRLRRVLEASRSSRYQPARACAPLGTAVYLHEVLRVVAKQLETRPHRR
jgi:NTE family protein